jgi:hypothetical protein
MTVSYWLIANQEGQLQGEECHAGKEGSIIGHGEKQLEEDSAFRPGMVRFKHLANMLQPPVKLVDAGPKIFFSSRSNLGSDGVLINISYRMFLCTWLSTAVLLDLGTLLCWTQYHVHSS